MRVDHAWYFASALAIHYRTQSLCRPSINLSTRLATSGSKISAAARLPKKDPNASDRFTSPGKLNARGIDDKCAALLVSLCLWVLANWCYQTHLYHVQNQDVGADADYKKERRTPWATGTLTFAISVNGDMAFLCWPNSTGNITKRCR